MTLWSADQNSADGGSRRFRLRGNESGPQPGEAGANAAAHGEVMPDSSTPISALKDLVRRFGEERAWQPYHSPKNLSMGLAVEAAELMEHFLWCDGEHSRALGFDPARREAIADEVADVFCYVLNLCVVLELDLADELQRKLAKNAIKYPVDKYLGRYEAAKE